MPPAFLAPLALPRPSLPRPPRTARPRLTSCAPPPVTIPSSPSPTPSSSPIPSSLSAATSAALNATRAAFAAGATRTFIVIDTTAGDETYTLLKNSVPIVRGLLAVHDGPTEVLLPDAGAAALARRDWGENGGTVPDGVDLGGVKRWRKRDETEGIFIVAPRASEVEDLEAAVVEAGDARIVVVNPDLIDMGLTGLSLNARMLRERVINTFETSYYLKVTGWGVLLREFPGEWGVWVDDAGEASGFRCIGMRAEKPNSEEIEEMLDEDAGESGSGGDWITKLGRFMKVYMKG